MWLVRLSLVALLANIAHAAVAQGHCDKAKPGYQVEKCSVECNTHGTCKLSADGEYCDCNGMAQFTGGSITHQADGTMSGRGGSNAACEEFEKRCSKDCKKGGKGFSDSKVAKSKLR